MNTIERESFGADGGELLLERALTRLVNPRPLSTVATSPSRAKIKLSQRETQIVGFVAMGLRNFEIAERLKIGEQTVKNHLHNIFQKAAVRDRLDLALYAVYNRLYTV